MNEKCERFVIVVDIDLTDMRSSSGNSYQAYLNQLYVLQTISSFWPEETYNKVKSLIYQMHAEYVNQKPAWEFGIRILSELLIFTAIRTFPKREVPSQEPLSDHLLFQKVITYIADNFCNPITLTDCAKICGFNATYFSKYFKKHMRITFQEYVKNSRIEHAKWLLLTSKASITEISEQCGFSNIRIFDKLFKQATGETASSFRKNKGEVSVVTCISG